MAQAAKNTAKLSQLLAEIRACRLCADILPHEPRPVLRLKRGAKICIVGQAPGLRVHQSGVPFTDPSGVRLREWMKVTDEEFYDDSRVAIVPMGFCFPGYDDKGADKPPLKKCARTWRARIFETAPEFSLMLAVGTYAQRYHLGDRIKKTLTETVQNWQEYAPRVIPLPHPSWRNNAWLKKNPWFEKELLPYLRKSVRRALS
jgi:uracil-DNA glycosylase